MKRFFLSLMLVGAFTAQAQLRNADVYEVTEIDHSMQRNVVTIPGFDGYQTLKCDFHIHTAFSDGSVWPDMRVEEAWQEGLDAIAITDHIEYRPHKELLKGDLNESFKIAKKRGDELGFVVIHGSEITRSKPLGHLNALFLQDSNPMDVEDPLKAIDEAKRQGAFIMWNHPGWPDDKSTLYPVHEELLKANKIDGIEVFNFAEYYPKAFDWPVQYGKAFMGNTDIHGLIAGMYGWGKLVRPLTLVFATGRSEQAIREALFANRTAVLFQDVLVGPAEYLSKLVMACFQVRQINSGRLEVTNQSDISFKATVDGKLILLPARTAVQMDLPQQGPLVMQNCYVGQDKQLTFELYELEGMLR